MANQIGVSDESKKAIQKYADHYGIPLTEAADSMISVAISRLNALKRYADKKKGEKPAPKAKGKAAKPAKKAAKAKGPIARKTKTAAKAEATA